LENCSKAPLSELQQVSDYSELCIPGLRLWLSLGCSEEERKTLQPVDVDIKIQFMQDLPGFYSDEISEVICYHTLVKNLVASIQDQSFHLIEFATTQIFESVVNQLRGIDAVVEIVLTKMNHAVPHIHKGIAFKYARRVSQKFS